MQQGMNQEDASKNGLGEGNFAILYYRRSRSGTIKVVRGFIVSNETSRTATSSGDCLEMRVYGCTELSEMPKDKSRPGSWYVLMKPSRRRIPYGEIIDYCPAHFRDSHAKYT